MAEPITIQKLIDASIDSDSLEVLVNGDENTDVNARLGEVYPSAKKAIYTLFENGGLPAVAFRTKALMTASDLLNGQYAQVTDGGADSGLYLKEGGVWVKSEYDPVSKSKAYSDEKTEVDNSASMAHVFLDKEQKILASIDSSGKFDLDPSEATKKRLGVLTDNGDTDYAVLVLDAENKVLGGWDKYGNDMSSKGDSEPTDSFSPAPLTHEKSAVEITDFSRVIEKLNVNTVAKGRTTDPDVPLAGNGFTHPKLVYVPEGWNGYKYWLAVTPTFGITPSDAYENPHVFCSNDMLTWLEPTGAPLDLPDPSSSTGYWSDTHLVIDDDGWMYCIYRGNSFYGSTRFVVAKKSRDGLNWSDRIIIYTAEDGGVDNGILSPAIYKNGSKWQYIDILQDTGDLNFTSGYGRGVFRRSADTITGDYGTYTLDHLVNITNRPWGADKAPWHIDAIKVGNLYMLLLAVGGVTQSYSNELYLCWSTDGWNYTAFDKLNTLFDNCYRSSISFRDYKDGKINFDVIVARTTGFNGGNLDLFNLTLETK